jgi:CNT family concentrative nucleoside transporter
MTVILGVTGAESMSVAANVFVGQTEAPLVVRPYIARMTRSEMMALMVGGFATIAGSVMGIYMGMLGDTYGPHLLTASVMAAPAAFVLAKIMYPETEESETGSKVTLKVERTHVNMLDALAEGVTDGLKLALNVAAMLVAFVALIKLVDWPLSFITVGDGVLSLQRLFGWIFAPFAWVMGVESGDTKAFGSLLGFKIAVNEFVAYTQLQDLKAREGMSPRSISMAAYALCGFANFASIGIQIGGISPLAPERRGDLAKIGFFAMLAGALATCLTATIAGIFLEG